MAVQRGEGHRIWEEFIHHPTITPADPKTIWPWFALSETVSLFGQATLAFDAEAHAGTALLCRSTLEAACYVFLTRRKMEGQESAFWTDPPRWLDGKPRKVEFEELKSAIAKKGVLTEKQNKDLERIQEEGNVIAHLVSRTDRSLFQPLDERRKLRLWISQDEALGDLRDTAAIVKTLADSMAGRA